MLFFSFYEYLFKKKCIETFISIILSYHFYTLISREICMEKAGIACLFSHRPSHWRSKVPSPFVPKTRFDVTVLTVQMHKCVKSFIGNMYQTFCAFAHSRIYTFKHFYCCRLSNATTGCKWPGLECWKKFYVWKRTFLKKKFTNKPRWFFTIDLFFDRCDVPTRSINWINITHSGFRDEKMVFSQQQCKKKEKINFF